jgi:hypothetical protein
MTAEDYARVVVEETLKMHPRAYIWVGAQTWVAWFFHTFLGQAGFVRQTPLFSLYYISTLLHRIG